MVARVLFPWLPAWRNTIAPQPRVFSTRFSSLRFFEMYWPLSPGNRHNRSRLVSLSFVEKHKCLTSAEKRKQRKRKAEANGSDNASPGNYT